MTLPIRSLLWLSLVVTSAAVAARARAADDSATVVTQDVLDNEAGRIEAIARASACTVSVFAPGGQGGGSGVVVTSDGYALTNFHVTKPCGDHMKCGMPDGRLYDAVIVGIDPTGDVALIKLLGREDFPHAEMGDSDAVRVGDWCFAVGNPFLLATDFQPTVSFGIVSGVHRYQYPAGTLLEYADCLQTDAAINPGNSGGPLFDVRGQLIGINGRGSFEKRGRVNVGVGYAISINQIRHFMGYLRSGRIVDHATLGATVSNDQDGRLLVTNILESSDAFRRGLRYGDEVVRFGGRAISTANEFKNVLGIYPKAWRIPLTYRRDGQRHDVLVRLSGVHAEEELLTKVTGGPRPADGPRPGPGDEKPSEEKPGEQTPDQEEKDEEEGKQSPIPLPDRPIPRPARARPAVRPPAPPEVAKLIKSRTGYANYYFNELNRDRVWKSFSDRATCLPGSGAWTLTGRLASGEPVGVRLGAGGSSIRWPSGDVTIDRSKDFSEQLVPDGSGGLLVALHLWRRLLTVGPEKFGDVYYLGTAPVVDHEGLHDILIGTHDVIESSFQFDPETGLLVGIEMYPDEDRDPCEVFFRDYREVEGRLLPHGLEVRHGDEVFAEIQWDRIEIAESAEGES